VKYEGNLALVNRARIRLVEISVPSLFGERRWAESASLL
jgi:hypothetical protein